VDVDVSADLPVTSSPAPRPVTPPARAVSEGARFLLQLLQLLLDMRQRVLHLFRREARGSIFPVPPAAMCQRPPGSPVSNSTSEKAGFQLSGA
jgi:hypothetical protein